MGRQWLSWVALGIGIGTATLQAGPADGDSTPITVGTGVNSAALDIAFASGALFAFDVQFGDMASDTLTGLDLFDIVEADTTLTTQRLVFDFGVLIDGIRFMGEDDAGFGGGENYWHYWIQDPGQNAWQPATVGVGDRIVADGARDGWVYGSALPPGMVPEPASFVLVTLGGAALLRGRRDR